MFWVVGFGAYYLALSLAHDMWSSCDFRDKLYVGISDSYIYWLDAVYKLGNAKEIEVTLCYAC